MRHARADAAGGRRSARAADLRDHRRVGVLLRRQGRHHAAGGGRAQAGAAAAPTGWRDSTSPRSGTWRGTAQGPRSATPPSCGPSPRPAGRPRPAAPPLAISTIKGNIGHTKAAAGVAGLIKATMAVHHQVIPPATGHADPHPMLTEDAPALRVPLTAELWPGPAHPRRRVRHGVRRDKRARRPRRRRRSPPQQPGLPHDPAGQLPPGQRAAAAGRREYRGPARRAWPPSRSCAAVWRSPSSATWPRPWRRECGGGPVRAAIVAASPDQAEQRLARAARGARQRRPQGDRRGRGRVPRRGEPVPPGSDTCSPGRGRARAPAARSGGGSPSCGTSTRRSRRPRAAT